MLKEQMNKMIKSLEKGIKILEHIIFEGGAGISHISQELNLNKSTVFGVIKTLESLGYVFKEDAGNCYRATYRIQTLANTNVADDSIVSYSRPFFIKFNKKYNETVHFVRSLMNAVVYLEKIESTKSVRIYSSIGSEQPLYCTAVGKSILAWRSEKEIAEYLNMIKLIPLTSHTIVRPEELLDEIKEVRRQGYSIDDEEYQEGLYCISVPIFSKHDEVKYAISISMPKFRKDDYDLEIIVKDLKGIATQISSFF